MMKRNFYPFVVTFIAVFLLASGLGFSAEQKKAEPKKDTLAVLETDQGKIVISFYDQDAPKTVTNFKKLIREGYYDGTYFHRVIPGFMIQGGDSNTKDDNRSNDGMGGPGYTIPAEFNAHKHVRGTISMARKRDPNSAGSQFFVCVDRAAYLDGKYTVFGKVVEGMDVVDKIVKAKRDRRDNPIQPIHIQKAYLK